MNKADQRILDEYADELPPYTRPRWPRVVMFLGVGMALLGLSVIGLELLSNLTLHVVIDR